MTLVHQLMTSPVATVHIGASLDAAARLMWDHDCGVVPVVDDFGRLVGVVTDRDACMAAYTRGAALRDVGVATVMCNDVITCRSEDSIPLAMRLMETHQLRRLPVVDDDRCPIGILAVNDLVRHAIRPSAGQRDAVQELIHALATIGRPRRKHVAADDDVAAIANGAHPHFAAVGER